MASIQSKSGKGRSKTYYVVYSKEGKQKWLKGGTLADARRLKKQIESFSQQDAAERLGLLSEDKRIDEFFGLFLQHLEPHVSESTLSRYKAALNPFVAYLRLHQPSLRVLSQIRQDNIEEFQRLRLTSIDIKVLADGKKIGNHNRKKLPSPQTVNYEIGILNSAFVWAEEHEWILKIPTRRVRKLRSAPIRIPRIMDENECKKFMDVASKILQVYPSFRDCLEALQFILNTGLRSNELCNLQWCDVDLRTGLIQIRAKADWSPKTGSRAFYLNDTCLNILNRRIQETLYIFCKTNGTRLRKNDLRRALIRISEEAGIEGLTRVHDLRHTFSSLWQMKGVQRGTISEILGHSTERTTAIYSHQTATHLKKSINALNIM